MGSVFPACSQNLILGHLHQCSTLGSENQKEKCILPQNNGLSCGNYASLQIPFAKLWGLQFHFPEGFLSFVQCLIFCPGPATELLSPWSWLQQIWREKLLQLGNCEVSPAWGWDGYTCWRDICLLRHLETGSTFPWEQSGCLLEGLSHSQPAWGRTEHLLIPWKSTEVANVLGHCERRCGERGRPSDHICHEMLSRVLLLRSKNHVSGQNAREYNFKNVF